MISSNLDFQINLYFTTKAGLFLPFETLDEVYLIDESNSMYIQDQNSFYYDAREIVYFLAQVHKAQLYIVSSFESVRMFNYKKEQNIKENDFKLNNPTDNNSISSETETTIAISTESKASYNVKINEEKNINTLETDSNILASDNINIKVSERTPQNMAPNGIFSWEIEKLLLKDVD